MINSSFAIKAFWFVCRRKLLVSYILVFLLTLVSIDKVYFWNSNFIDSHMLALIYHLYEISSCGNRNCVRVLRLFCSTRKPSSDCPSLLTLWWLLQSKISVFRKWQRMESCYGQMIVSSYLWLECSSLRVDSIYKLLFDGISYLWTSVVSKNLSIWRNFLGFDV